MQEPDLVATSAHRCSALHQESRRGRAGGGGCGVRAAGRLCGRRHCLAEVGLAVALEPPAVQLRGGLRGQVRHGEAHRERKGGGLLADQDGVARVVHDRLGGSCGGPDVPDTSDGAHLSGLLHPASTPNPSRPCLLASVPLHASQTRQVRGLLGDRCH